MNPVIIKAMVHALEPTLKDTKKAQQILERYWSKKIAIVWYLGEVHTAANERQIALTNKEAASILKHFLDHHDKQLGLRWSDFTSYIEENALGRKMTKAEVNQFVHKNVLTIQR